MTVALPELHSDPDTAFFLTGVSEASSGDTQPEKTSALNHPDTGRLYFRVFTHNTYSIYCLSCRHYKADILLTVTLEQLRE